MTGVLNEQAIAVTGAGAGLGRAYAVACAAAGAHVVVNDVDASRAHHVVNQIRSAGGSAVAHPASSASWEGAEGLVESALAHFGRLDGLVANAGVKHEAFPWDETENRLRRILEVNVLGVQFCGVHAMRAMIESGRGGSIVTVVSGARLGIRAMSAYGASKGAVEAMSAGWAIDGAPHGIRVNAVSPLAETAMSASDGRPDRPRLGSPATVAPLIVALLSPGSRGISGHTFRFDGDVLGHYAPPAIDRSVTVSREPKSAAVALAGLMSDLTS